MREGPFPLSAHISMAAASLAQHGDSAALELQNMLRGIRAYQLSPYQPQRPALEILWRQGEMTIGAVPGTSFQEGRPVMLLIPSMVNRASILDLMEERSLLRWLNAQGIAACLLEWGEGVKDEGQQTIEGVVIERLAPALQFMAQYAGAPVHALGYCMGGTLLAGAALHAPECTKSLTFLAAPWDFHAGQSLLSRVKFWAPSAVLLLAEKKHLPMDWVQTVFASVDPLLTARKFAKFADMDPESEEAKLFIAVEDWLNDGIDLPADVARQAIYEWFLENQTGALAWTVGGRAVDPAAIEVPALVIASAEDRLVEYETAAALATQIPGAKLVNPACGHIGMIAGRKAQEKVWQPVAAFVQRISK